MLLLQDKTDPVEEEGGEKCSEENEIVAKKGDVLFSFPVVAWGIPPGSPRRRFLSLIFHVAGEQLLLQLLRLLEMEGCNQKRSTISCLLIRGKACCNAIIWRRLKI